MKRFRARPVCLLFLALAQLSGPLLAQQLGEKVPNWAVPSAAHGSKGGMTTQADIGLGGAAFIPVDPCRIVNTRNAGFPAGFGPPSLAAATPRDFALLAGPCTGFPPAVLAYSLNITVTNTLGPGFIKVYPQGGAVPPVSTLNYNGILPPGLAIANAAVVPAGVGSGITVLAGVSGTDLLIDINGYFIGNGPVAPLNPNESVAWQGNTTSAVVFGANTNANGVGVAGTSPHVGVVGVSDGSGLSHAGVVGQSTDAIGTYGGSTSTYGMVAQSVNFDALAANGGRDGAFIQGARHGAIGISNATSGETYGVAGANGNTTFNSAGVFGQEGSPPALAGYYPAGVLGSSGIPGYGVLGVSQFEGVQGVVVDGSGSMITGGKLAFPPYGVYSQGDYGGTGAKYFVEPHPEDATKVIRYVCLEGPESGTYFRGRGRFVNGAARIEVPESFRIVSDSDGLTVQITPIGKPTAVAVTRMSLEGIEAEATGDVEFCYIVHGVRKAFKDFEAIAEGSEFRPETAEQKMPAYLTAEARRRLIANGTYNADGTVNMATAERVGWTKIWADQKAAAREAAAKAAEERSKQFPVPAPMVQIDRP
jgi:hypothetical protein